jgi:ketosteroid isomerase-like protein
MNPTAATTALSATPASPVDILQALLQDPTNPELVHRLVAPDVTYVSLNFDNPDLHKLMPWCGTYTGPQAIIDTFIRIAQFWKALDFKPDVVFGDQENVALRGHATWTSAILNKTVSSPYAIFAQVKDGKITYMQFMEDTFMTASSFRSGGTWYFESNPNGEKVAVGDDA